MSEQLTRILLAVEDMKKKQKQEGGVIKMTEEDFLDLVENIMEEQHGTTKYNGHSRVSNKSN